MRPNVTIPLVRARYRARRIAVKSAPLPRRHSPPGGARKMSLSASGMQGWALIRPAAVNPLKSESSFSLPKLACLSDGLSFMIRTMTAFFCAFNDGERDVEKAA